jgi:hypothetical protein
MKAKSLVRSLSYFAAVGLSIFLLFFIITCSWIGHEVRSRCKEAKREYGGDCVEALATVLKDENHSFRERNSAIWALGQLGDSRALPVLRNYYTGNIPPREPLDKVISQYELEKAIKLANGGFNISALIWRSGLAGKKLN